MFCTTNLTSRHGILRLILHFTQIQTTTVSLLQLMVIGDSHSALKNTVLSVNLVSDYSLFRISDFTLSKNV